MGLIFRESFIRLVYTLIASAGVYVSLWNRADVARDRFVARRSADQSSYDFIVGKAMLMTITSLFIYI